MSRPLRIQYPNAWYHVMNRGRRGETVFQSKDDYHRFIDILHEAIELFSLRISAYCLMTNHYHLLVQTPDANDIIFAVCNLYGIGKAQLFAARRGEINEARNMAIYLLRYLRGDSLTNIGKEFDIHSYSTVSSVIERFKVRMQTERKLLRNVEKIRKTIMRQGQT
jgi:chromosomal replication initiation ATPase DnaA